MHLAPARGRRPGRAAATSDYREPALAAPARAARSGLAFFRGLAVGLPLSLALWGAIVWAVLRLLR